MLAAFQRIGRAPIVTRLVLQGARIAFGIAATQEGHRKRVLTRSGCEADVLEAAVDLRHCIIQTLIDCCVIVFATDFGAPNFLAIEQCDDRVLELHVGHSARQRHVADGEHVVTVGREVVQRAHATARTKGHAVLVATLIARASGRCSRQRQNHVGHQTIGGLERHRLRIAYG